MIKVGIIGFGYWGPNYARVIEKIPDATLVAVADKIPQNLETVAGFSAKTFTNHHKLLESNVDAVVVTTPTTTHYQIVSDCLSAGKHVLCEKPLALKTDECKNLTALATKNKKILMVGYTFIYNQAFQAFKQFIKTDKIGDLYYLSFSRMNLGPVRNDVNAMWDLAPHDVSMLISILSALPQEVFSMGGSYLNNNQDVVFSSIKFKNGVIAHISTSWLAPIKIRTVTAVASKKMAIFDDVEPKNKVSVFNKGFKIPARGSSYKDFSKAALRKERIIYPHIKNGEPLSLQFKHFLNCISQKKKPTTDGQFATSVTRVLEACQLSLKTHQVVKL